MLPWFAQHGCVALDGHRIRAPSVWETGSRPDNTLSDFSGDGKTAVIELRLRKAYPVCLTERPAALGSDSNSAKIHDPPSSLHD